MTDVRFLRPTKSLFLNYRHIQPNTNPFCSYDEHDEHIDAAFDEIVGKFQKDLPHWKSNLVRRLLQKFRSFARKENLSPERISTAISIIVETFWVACGPDLPCAEIVFQQFRAMLIRHSVRRSPRSIAVYSLIEVKSFTSFFIEHVFRYLRHYQHVFGRTRLLALHSVSTLAPNPSSIPALSTAVLTPDAPTTALTDTELSTNETQAQNASSLAESTPQTNELTDDEIQLVLSDPVAKAEFQRQVENKLASLQRALDQKLDELDKNFQEQASFLPKIT